METRLIQDPTLPRSSAGVGERPVVDRVETGRLEVRISSGVGGLVSLRQDWEELLSSLPERNFTHAFGWHLAYLRNLELTPESVYFFSFFRAGRPLAIFPLRYRQRRLAGLALNVWELPTHPHVPLADALMAQNCDPEEVVSALVTTLNEVGLPWHALRLPRVPDKAPALKGARGAGVGTVFSLNTGTSMYFCCRDLLTSLSDASPAFRRNLRRQRKKLEQQGEVTLTVARSGQELDRAFADFLRLEASGWKGRKGEGTAILLHPRLFSYYREVKEDFAAHDSCLVAQLKLNGLTIAAQFGVITDKTLYLHGIAYNEAWHAEAPGHQLLHDVLEYCAATPDIARLSLIAGPAWADGRWNPRRFNVWEVWLFKAMALGLVCAVVRWLEISVGEKLRRTWRSLTTRWSPNYQGVR